MSLFAFACLCLSKYHLQKISDLVVEIFEIEEPICHSAVEMEVDLVETHECVSNYFLTGEQQFISEAMENLFYVRQSMEIYKLLLDENVDPSMLKVTYNILDTLEYEISVLPHASTQQEMINLRYNLMQNFSELNYILDYHFQILSRANFQKSREVALESIQEFTKYLIWAFVASIILSIILLFYFVPKIVYPLQLLKNRVSKVTQGNLYEAIPVKSNDEIGELSKAFNMMIEQLHVNQQNLMKAMSEVQVASDVKDSFINNINHELKTPMNLIVGLGDILKNTPLQEDQKNYLQTISASSQTLLKMINDILDFTRYQGESAKLDDSVFNIYHFCKNIQQTYIQEATKKGLAFFLEVSTECNRQVCGDIYKLNQILVCFLNNAVKFTKHGAVSLKVKVIEEKEGELVVQFNVHDTGIGIPEERHAELFSRFHQLDMGLKREFGGLGLGLSLAKKSIEFLGGEYGVESEVEKGSRFWFSLEFVKV